MVREYLGSLAPPWCKVLGPEAVNRELKSSDTSMTVSVGTRLGPYEIRKGWSARCIGRHSTDSAAGAQRI